MGDTFQFEHRVHFHPQDAEALLRSVPAAPGVFALRGDAGQPYLSRTADLRRRLRRLLAPPEQLDEHGTLVLSKRLNLRDRVRFIDYTGTGSDFESTLVLYHASRSVFGAEEARRRLRLHTPYFLRVTMSHPHPRVYATNRLSKKSLPESFGPFPSRAAAERYGDAALDLFKLRRCYEDLEPHPGHPGCVYGEMNKCLMPCKEGNSAACTPAEYAAEAARVFAFFQTRGQSLLDEVAAQREAASEAMDFETAATLHRHWEKVRAAAALADDLVRPVPDLRAVILQRAAPTPRAPGLASDTWDSTPAGSPNRASEMWASTTAQDPESAAVFLLANGHLCGPAPLSTLGVRAVREQTAVGSSLFAQPLMLAPVPLDEPAEPTLDPSQNLSSRPEPALDPSQNPSSRPEPSTNLSSRPERSAVERPAAPSTATTLNPEDRARAVLTHLATQAETAAPLDELCDALSLFRRWYYRPEKQRTGEVFLPNAALSPGDRAGTWPVRRILNGAARVVLGPPAEAPPVDREAAKALKTKVLHPGREGVEREVPILPKRPRTRKAITPSDTLS